MSGGANLVQVLMCGASPSVKDGGSKKFAISVSLLFTLQHVSRVNALLPLRHFTANNEAFCLLSGNCLLKLRTCFS